MGDLDNMFARAVGAMTGKVASEESTSITGLKKDASDMDILDYIVSQLCTCLDSSKLAFHGGYILNKIIKDEVPRGTVDVDVSIHDKEYYAAVQEVLKSIGKNLVEDGIMKDYKVNNTATEEWSGGLDLYWPDGIKRRKLGVDIGVRDTSHGLVPIQLTGIDTIRFSIERMLADKLSAIYSIKRFRRTKDLYDFYIITQCFDVDVSKLRMELEMEGVIKWEESPMNDDVCIKYKESYEKLIVYSGSERLSVNELSVPFDRALGRVSWFVSNIDKDVVWEHGKMFKNR